MAGHCIPANPDVSGIGVRIAIYTQNFLCFAPVVAHLWDGNVTADELKGVKDQSIGMLAIAFAILISTITQATTFLDDQLITNFHAAVILDLSWMNNTSTWIWFLLYAHHRSKADKNPIPAIWSEWRKILLSPLDKLFHGRDEEGGNEKGDENQGSGQTSDSAGNCDAEQVVESQKPSKSKVVSPIVACLAVTSPNPRLYPSFIRRLSLLVLQAPVLTLGSIHLSLMAAIGIWLWSNPTGFGKAIPCDPSLTIVGGAVPFSSTALKVCSLLIYSLLLIPGVNLVPPFLFFFSLHILYNYYRKPNTPIPTRRIGGIIHALFLRRRPRSSDVEADSSAHGPVFSTATHSAQSEAHAKPIQPHSQSAPTPEVHTAFLVIGLQCLVVVNILFLVDVELTLSRNKHFQFDGEGLWGFGQVLALLLLVVPLRDFATSIVDIRNKIWEANELKRKAQQGFEQHLREAIEGDTLEGYDFPDLIARGADPNTRLQCKYNTLLQFAGHKGNSGLIQYLLDKGVDDDSEGTTFKTAAQDDHFGTAFLLLEHKKKWDAARQTAIHHLGEFLKGSHRGVCLTAITILSRLGARVEWREDIRTIILECLKGIGWNARQAAIQVISKLGAQAEWQDDIRMALPIIVDCLNDKDRNVRQAAVEGLSRLGTQAEWQAAIRTALPIIVKCLNDEEGNVRQATVESLSRLGARAEWQQEDIRIALSIIVKSLNDKDSNVRQATVEGLSRLGAQAEWREDIQTAIPGIVECLKDEDSDVRQAAIEGLSRLGARAGWQADIRMALPIIVECLNDKDKNVRQAAIKELSTLGAQAELREDIQTAIPGIVKCLKEEEEDRDVRMAATEGLSKLATYAELKEDIRKAFPGIVKDKDMYVRMAAIVVLSGLGAQPEWREDIRSAIRDIAECLKHSYWIVRNAAIVGLSTLGAHAEWQEDIRTILPGIVECLKDRDGWVRQAAIEGLSRLGAQIGWREDTRTALPVIVECLKDEYRDVRQAAIEGLSMLGEHAEWQEDIRQALSGIVEDEDMYVRVGAIAVLSGLGVRGESREDIRSAIPGIVECLKHRVSFIRQAAIDGLSRLGAQCEFQKDIGMAIPGIVECLGDSYRVSLAVVEVLSRLAKLDAFGQIRYFTIFLFIEWIRNKLGHDQPDDDFDRILQDLPKLLFDTNPDSLDV